MATLCCSVRMHRPFPPLHPPGRAGEHCKGHVFWLLLLLFAFKTIRPALLGEMLTAMQVDASLVSWIVNYLTGRPQYVCLQHCVGQSGQQHWDPAGDSPILFTLYTTDFNDHTESWWLCWCLSKGEAAEYSAVVGNFITWCEQNYLHLNPGGSCIHPGGQCGHCGGLQEPGSIHWQ